MITYIQDNTEGSDFIKETKQYIINEIQEIENLLNDLLDFETMELLTTVNNSYPIRMTTIVKKLKNLKGYLT